MSNRKISNSLVSKSLIRVSLISDSMINNSITSENLIRTACFSHIPFFLIVEIDYKNKNCNNNIQSWTVT